MTHVANDLIGKPERRQLYESGAPVDPDEVRAGMFLVSRSGTIEQVVVRAEPGKKLPEAHGYSRPKASGGWTCGRWTDRDCVCFSMRGAPRAPDRVALHYRDVTEDVHERLG